MRELTDRAEGRPDVAEPAASWLPFTCVVPVASGRSAEALLCRSWPGPRGIVVHNGLFPTWYLSLVDTGFTPVPIPGAREGTGDVDTAALAEVLSQHTGEVSFVCVEVSGNAGGGYPISPDNLRQVREVAAGHGVPLVLDGARIVENAVFVADREGREGREGRDVWEVVRELLGLADSATFSLSKDFGVSFGGLLATRDPVLAERVRERVMTQGRDVNLGNRKILAAAVEDRDTVVAQVRRKVDAVRTLWEGLSEGGVPVVGPAAGHCVLLDVGRMEPFADHDHPVMSCLAWIYRETGVLGWPASRPGRGGGSGPVHPAGRPGRFHRRADRRRAALRAVPRIHRRVRHRIHRRAAAPASDSAPCRMLRRKPCRTPALSPSPVRCPASSPPVTESRPRRRSTARPRAFRRTCGRRCGRDTGRWTRTSGCCVSTTPTSPTRSYGRRTASSRCSARGSAPRCS